MKRLALTLTAAAVIATGGVATAYAVQSDDKPATSPTAGPSSANPSAGSSTGVPTGSLTAAKAAEQAVKDVPGGVVTDVDWDDNKWELDVHGTAGWRELSYDANGKLLSNRADNHSDDSGNDSADDRNDDHGGDRSGHDDHDDN
ncbi:hypothetical protein OG474_28700 [Kribbella sp. NBC_01505]|uniref:hypothetical protein n=1 Tax=Kribbella sp. NBC_01505 TaxID=2903580 RepID=UPI003870B666